MQFVTALISSIWECGFPRRCAPARWTRRWLAGALLLFLVSISDAVAQTPGGSAMPPSTALPGVHVAQAITEVTGVAVSPLAGLSAVGAWRYMRAPAPARAALPWFCQPWFWGTGVVIFLLGTFKHTVASVLPLFFLKPLDYVGVVGNMAGALLACPTFIPLVLAEFEGKTAGPVAGISGGPLTIATLPLAMGGFAWWMWIAVPVATAGFLLVWLGGHAITVLSALCPVGILTALLKLFKAGIVALIVFSALLSPWIGAFVCLLILAVAAFIAPWAFRLTVFGSLFGYDLLLPGRARRGLEVREPHAFLACRLGRVPARNYGRLARTPEGHLVFRYRPWMVLPWRSVALPPDALVIEKGLIHPCLAHRLATQKPPVAVLHFLPRYRKYESEVAEQLAVTEILETPVLRGLRALRAWLSEFIHPRHVAYSHPTFHAPGASPGIAR